MQAWNLQQEDLPSLTLAADARLCSPNYYNDQIWELHLSEGEPAALSLQTTYGLRVRSMRLFPRFIEGDRVRNDPEQFSRPPTIRRFYPNYAQIACSPFLGIDVVCEYWVPGSNVVAGRLQVTNTGVTTCNLRLAWAALLIPGETGGRMVPSKIQSVNVLQGKLNDLVPILFLTGGAEASLSPYPNLSVQTDLPPRQDHELIWVHAALPDPDEAFTLIRRMVTRNWEAEITRIEMINASQVEIYTGDPNWDVAFALGQKTAFQLINGPTEHLPHPSFTLTRNPDQGFSLHGDGSDYDHLWNGQPVLETWHLCNQLLPAAPELTQGLLLNFLATQDEEGRIDLKPSLNGKRSGILATPLLCSLVWKIYPVNEDQNFLKQSFPPLLKFVNHWFSAAHDRDGDGIPEWDNLMQSGFEDNPNFAYWQPWSQGADISMLESPSLSAMLYRECHRLKQIASELDRLEAIPDLETKIDNLRVALEFAWDPKSATHCYLDRETHSSPSGIVLGKWEGPGKIRAGVIRFTEPRRLSIRLHPQSEETRNAHVTIQGADPRGQEKTETISPTGLRWSLGIGTAISENIYSVIEHIQIRDIKPETQVIVQTIDYNHHDQTSLLPLWIGVLSTAQARTLVRENITNPERYWKSYGLPACPVIPAPEAATVCESIWIPWNSLIGEGLLAYGYQEQAAELLSRLMSAIVQNLQRDGHFRKHYHSETGEGIGERNTLLGLPPLDLFLKTLGVQLISPWKVGLQGRNPFPWPVTIKFRGLTIDRGFDETRVTFPSGQTASVRDPAACIVDGRARSAENLTPSS